MRFNIKATNITIGNDVREYLDKRLTTLQKFIDLADPAIVTAVELGRSTNRHQNGDVFYAEITIYKGKVSWRAVANESTLTSAIDAMHEGITREVTQSKGKKRSLFRRGGIVAKQLLRGGYDGLEYLGRPAKAGWKYLKSFRSRKDSSSSL